MKKILALALALLMLALPAFSMAESPLAGLPIPQSFLLKYLQQGQRLVTDVSIQPNEALMAQSPEELKGPLQDLFQALKLEVSSQKAGEDMQGTLRILLNGETGADITVAKGEKGIFVGSSFLGDKTIQITPEQIDQLMDQALQQMVEQGQITQEQVAGMKARIAQLQSDPQAVIASLVGNADPSALLAALQGLVTPSAQAEEVTEIPEGVTIEAKYVGTITIGKEAMKKVTTELGKFLWSMPIVQQVAASIKSETPVTEDALVAKLNSIPDSLAEDVVIKVYMTEDNSAIQAVCDIKVIQDGKEIPVNLNMLIQPKENGVHVIYQVKGTENGENTYAMQGDMDITTVGASTEVTYLVTMTMNDNGTEFTAVEESIKAVQTGTDTERTLNMDVTVKVKPNASADPVELIYAVEGAEKDLGDHAEQNLSINVKEAKMGDFVTITVEAKTDLAEAYITGQDGAQIISMTDEEKQTFLNEVISSAQVGLIGLISKLPESVQPLVLQLMGGQQ